MSFMIRVLNKHSAGRAAHCRICMVLVLLIAPVSIALADQPATAEAGDTTRTTQSPVIDPITGLAYGAEMTISGMALTVDAEGHPRALCADPADSLAPAMMRDAIQPNVSRLRYE